MNDNREIAGKDSSVGKFHLDDDLPFDLVVRRDERMRDADRERKGKPRLLFRLCGHVERVLRIDRARKDLVPMANGVRTLHVSRDFVALNEHVEPFRFDAAPQKETRFDFSARHDGRR